MILRQTLSPSEFFVKGAAYLLKTQFLTNENNNLILKAIQNFFKEKCSKVIPSNLLKNHIDSDWIGFKPEQEKTTRHIII